jgi:hypothetical protein
MGIKDIAKTGFHLLKGKLLEKNATGNQSQFNLNKFIGQMQEVNSVAQPSRYLVEISVPGWAAGKAGSAQRLSFFCDAVNMPGMTLAMSEFKSQGYGSFDRRPTAPIMQDITCSIMLDSNGNNLGFFQEWMLNIVNMDVSKSMLSERNGTAPFEIKYRDNYLTEITITMFDMAGTAITKLTAYECFPSVLGDVALGWNSTDEIARLSVNFQVRYWTTEQLEGTAAPGPRALSGFEQLLRIGTAATSLRASLKKPNNVGDVINQVSNAQTFLKSFGGG